MNFNESYWASTSMGNWLFICRNGVFAALAYKRMYCATENSTKAVQQEHKGAIAGCLTSFLSINTVNKLN